MDHDGALPLLLVERHCRVRHSHDVGTQTDVGAASGLQRNGLHAEVLQTVEDGVEPHVLHPALTVRVDDEAEVLGATLEVEGEHELALARLTLSYQERAVGGGLGRRVLL